MGIRVRAGGVNRCLLVGHVEVDKFEAGAGGEQCLEQGGEHGVQFSTVSLPLHQECGRTTFSWESQRSGGWTGLAICMHARCLNGSLFSYSTLSCGTTLLSECSLFLDKPWGSGSKLTESTSI